MELTPMIVFRRLSTLAVAGALSLTAGVVTAQHEVGGGSTKDAANGGDSSSRSGSRATVKRTRSNTTAVRRLPRTPVRRATTAEQYNQQGDELFEAKQYDDALELYLRAVQLRPMA